MRNADNVYRMDKYVPRVTMSENPPSISMGKMGSNTWDLSLSTFVGSGHALQT